MMMSLEPNCIKYIFIVAMILSCTHFKILLSISFLIIKIIFLFQTDNNHKNVALN